MENTLSELKEIDLKLMSTKNEVIELVAKMEFSNSQEFTIANQEKLRSLCSEIKSKKGLYLFSVKSDSKHKGFNDWVEDFQRMWHKEENGEQAYTPQFYKKRIEEHQKLEEWVPIYLGKSQKLGKRIEGHLDLKFEQGTYALKFNERKNLSNYIFKLETIKLEMDSYNWIVSTAESKKRNQIHPIIGKQ